MREQQQTKHAIITGLLSRFPGDELIEHLCAGLQGQNLRDTNATLILFFAFTPAYDDAIILLQDGLNAQRRERPGTHKNAWEIVWAYREMFEKTPPFFVRDGESFESAAKRLRWQLGEQLG